MMRRVRGAKKCVLKGYQTRMKKLTTALVTPLGLHNDPGVPPRFQALRRFHEVLLDAATMGAH
jgi:hypothetical protein